MFILMAAGFYFTVFRIALGIPIYASVRLLLEDFWLVSFCSNLYPDDLENEGQKTMLNSEKWFLYWQDLDHTRQMFKALRGPRGSCWVSLLGFLPQAQEIYEKVRFDFQEVNVNLAQIVAEDHLILKGLFSIWMSYLKTPDDYLSALVSKADLYQMEGLTDVARDKLLEGEVNYQMTHWLFWFSWDGVWTWKFWI